MKHILITLIALISFTVYAEVKPLAMEGYLGQSTRFRIDSFYDTETELVWGQTSYFRKNGTQSHIQVLGSYIDKVDLSGDSIKKFYLTEFVNNKICGHFEFELEWSSIQNGKWYLDNNNLDFHNVKSTTISDPYQSLIHQEPNGDLMYQRNEYLEVYCPINYTQESIVDGVEEYIFSMNIDKAVLLPKVCQDAIDRWIKKDLDYLGYGNYYDMAKFAVEKAKKEDDGETAEFIESYNVTYQSTKYITYSNSYETYSRGAAHPQHGETCITFDKGTGKILTWSDLFTEPNRKAVEKIIKTEMIRQNGEDSFFDCEDPQIGTPSVGPYIVDGKICFHFKTYEVSPYSSGMPSCSIKPALLQQFLTPKAIFLLK